MDDELRDDLGIDPDSKYSKVGKIKFPKIYTSVEDYLEKVLESLKGKEISSDSEKEISEEESIPSWVSLKKKCITKEKEQTKEKKGKKTIKHCDEATRNKSFFALKTDPFVQTCGARLNITQARRRQYEGRFGPSSRIEQKIDEFADVYLADQAPDWKADKVFLSDLDISFLKNNMVSISNHLIEFHLQQTDANIFQSEASLIEAARRDKMLQDELAQLKNELSQRIRTVYKNKFEKDIHDYEIKLEREYKNRTSLLRDAAKQSLMEHTKNRAEKIVEYFDMKETIKKDRLVDLYQKKLKLAVIETEKEIWSAYQYKLKMKMAEDYENMVQRIKKYKQRCVGLLAEAFMKANETFKTLEANILCKICKMKDARILEEREQGKFVLDQIDIEHKKIQDKLFGVKETVADELDMARSENRRLTMEASIRKQMLMDVIKQFKKLLTMTLENKDDEFIFKFNRLCKMFTDSDSESVKVESIMSVPSHIEVSDQSENSYRSMSSETLGLQEVEVTKRLATYDVKRTISHIIKSIFPSPPHSDTTRVSSIESQVSSEKTTTGEYIPSYVVEKGETYKSKNIGPVKHSQACESSYEEFKKNRLEDLLLMLRKRKDAILPLQNS